MGKKQRQACRSLAEFHAMRPGLLATGNYIGEGFDDARLDTLFLTLPVSWRGTIAQYAGRLHRFYDGKREVRIYDYADLNVPMLARMFDRRCRGYEAVGYTMLLPASAVPGWPADVILPSDPVWKRDYAASVRRLIATESTLRWRSCSSAPPGREPAMRRASTSPKRDRSVPVSATGDARRDKRPLSVERGSTDCIRRRRWSEVDLLCDDTRVVVELDGAQHLGDPAAYRRDRRKDQLLQENGYLVLRFLAEDVGKELDACSTRFSVRSVVPEIPFRLGRSLPSVVNFYRC